LVDQRATVVLPTRERPLPRARPEPRGGRALRRVGILGTGSHTPERVLTNQDLERLCDTSDEWIVTRTGMRERRLVAAGETTSDLATAAGRRALDAAGLAAGDVELILVATVTPDHVCPPTACYVQQKLGAPRAAGFDVSAACSGFMNALSTGHHLVAAGAFGNALVIGADVLSSITDYQDRQSCVLFGDAAGAVVLAPDPDGAELLDHVLGIDGSGADLIIMPAGGSAKPASIDTVTRREHYLTLEGRKVFRFAVTRFAEVIDEVLARNGFTVGDLDLIVPHQANLRILEAAAERLGVGMDRLFVNVDRYGNTSSASVPLALDEAVRQGRIHRGDLVCLVAFGGGLTWGASLVRW
jgi:3-oxoacyl-[acyl-carrier-protein] synthase-3